MNCRNIRDQLPDVALGITPVPPEFDAHLAGCRDCAETVQALRATMNLLDEWTAPEPSPFWDVRMQARLREEQQKAATGWLHWLRRPALSVAVALSLVAGIGLYQAGRFMHTSDMPPAAAHVSATPGTAVGDLQYLDKNSDLLQNFDALDDLDGDDDADTNN
jgi:cytochrome c-type biogenesis protein CcmH/NrfG